jgi:phosphotriesterase-related protein
VEECRTGIRDSNICPGMLKCAVEAPQINGTNRSYLEIMAIVQKATGLPIIAHSHSASRNGLPMMDFFSERGVDPARVIIGHCLDSCDAGYVRELLARGCYVGCDRIYRHDGSLPRRIEVMAQLLKDGWARRMVLSHDFICYANHLNRRQRAASLPASSVHDDPLGLCVVHDLVIPALLARGATMDDIEQMTRRNPSALLAMQA